ncbi:GNAT family N-acetyltransferase [Nocardia vinacea]|uniref:GNAT family N-acetyltransferase n=1 Tax=Nocardia vinacea TaxID=96468 RepID=A0ABZ1YRS6_9NOCA|nr:GNAT family N-acetyltransferase [Nocardia vinacea]
MSHVAGVRSAVDVTLSARDFDDSESTCLLHAYAQERRGVVGFDDPPGLDKPSQYHSPSGLFVVAYTTAADPFACGGVRTYPDRDHVMEIRKMYVAPGYRKIGLGRRVLAELEQHAAAYGAHEVILETGSYNQAAMHMYTSAGYHLIPAYVPDRPDFIARSRRH